MKQHDLDIIKSRFDNCGINAPENMGEEFVSSAIKDVVPEPEQKTEKKNRIEIRFIAAAAACLAIVVAVSAVVPLFANQPRTSSAALANLRRFSSYEELKKAYESIPKPENNYILEDAVAADGANTGGAETGSAKSSESTVSAGGGHSETYTQVAGVDEADIVKTDGRHIFCVTPYEPELRIFNADGDDSRLAAEIDLTEYKAGDSGDGCWPVELYVSGSRLIVLTESCYNAYYRNSDYTYDSACNCTRALVFDVSDVQNPKLTDSAIQKGAYVSSRLIGSRLYTVSCTFTPFMRDLEESMPACGKGSTPDDIPSDRIYSVPNPESASFVTLTSFDIEDSAKQLESKSVLGAAGTVYCNENNMYLTSEKLDSYGSYLFYSADTATEIIKAKLDGDIEFTASCEITGYIDSQYSMDEKDGYLRVATTSADEKEGNCVRVFDSELNEVGAVKGFASGENIKAVRYLGDYAYVITYRQIDPLFVVDLSKPSQPKLMGSVEISGFSTMLVPVDENTVLGIGVNTSFEDDIEYQDGVKLALFDVSDKMAPKVLDSKTYDLYSPVTNEPKALVYNPERNDYIIPITDYSDENGGKGGMLNFRVENGRLAETDLYKTDDDEITRCIYTGDHIYFITDSDVQSLEYTIYK